MWKALEKHQCNKCQKCPFYWRDSWNSEQGCYLEEGRYGKTVMRLYEKLTSEIYSGCFIPVLILKLIWIIEDIRLKRYLKRTEKEIE